jgi:hypothetical protein
LRFLDDIRRTPVIQHSLPVDDLASWGDQLESVGQSELWSLAVSGLRNQVGSG